MKKIFQSINFLLGIAILMIVLIFFKSNFSFINEKQFTDLAIYIFIILLFTRYQTDHIAVIARSSLINFLKCFLLAFLIINSSLISMTMLFGIILLLIIEIHQFIPG